MAVNVQDALIGAALSLGVSIVGGVAVWYFTREPLTQPKVERLEYIVGNAKSFRATSNSFSLAPIRLRNSGTQSAKNVILAMALSPTIRIIDKTITPSSGPASGYELLTQTSSSFTLRIPTLAPSEIVDLDLMLSDIDTSGAAIGVKSESSIGTQLSAFSPNVEEGKGGKLPIILGSILLLSQLGVYKAYRRVIDRSVKQKAYPKMVNNTAFLYLHNGLAAKAEAMLEQEITTSGGDILLHSNYGLALALKGDRVGAFINLKAAEVLGGSKRDLAIYEFNKGLAALLLADVSTDVTTCFANALAWRGREIRRFAGFSTIVAELMRVHPEAFALFATKPQ